MRNGDKYKFIDYDGKCCRVPIYAVPHWWEHLSIRRIDSIFWALLQLKTFCIQLYHFCDSELDTIEVLLFYDFGRTTVYKSTNIDTFIIIQVASNTVQVIYFIV